MNVQRPKIALYGKRNFSEKLTVSFDFIRENWKPLFKYATYLILPVILIQSLTYSSLRSIVPQMELFMNSSAFAMVQTQMLSLLGNYLLNFALSTLAMLALSALFYALIQLYNRREERLEGITFHDFGSLMGHCAKRIFILGITLFFFICIYLLLMGLAAYFSLWTLALTVPLFLVLCIAATLTVPTYVFEDIPLFDAIPRAFNMGFRTWGGTFLILLVMGLIASLLQSIVSIPLTIVLVAKGMFTLSDPQAVANTPVWVNMVQYVGTILMLYASYITTLFGIVGIAYQYGHASEVTDSVTVVSDIDNFDNL
ncbi:MAG: hypothetical protein LBM62_04390 [Mediterranea sp.]|jgi:MFS family permease|nr:hypothetical protein [Mediterranea sp.]